MLIGLQYLRFIGCLLVVQAHLTRNFVGYYFLDAFFLISGFVMAMLITKSNLAQDKFVKDRLTRAVPFYWSLTLGIFLLALAVPGLLASGSGDPVNLLKSLFFIPYYNAHGILSPLLPVAWTLNYEIILYILCCLSFQFRINWRVPFVMIGVTAVYVYGTLFKAHGPAAELYSGHYLLDFPMGMLVWLLYAKHRERLMLGKYQAMAVIIVTLAFMFYAEYSWSKQVDWFWLYSVPGSLVIWAVLCYEPYIKKDGAFTRFVCLIGDASFSIYLTHIFFIEAVHKTLPKLLPGFMPGLFTQAATFVCCIVMGILIDRYYDKPSSRVFRAWLGRMGPFGRMSPQPVGSR